MKKIKIQADPAMGDAGVQAIMARKLLSVLRPAYPILYPIFHLSHRIFWTPFNYLRYRGREHRRLEIGPGRERIPGFETLSVFADFNVDYLCDASRRLPFANDTFELIYASHVLEHISWYQCLDALQEWTRTLKPGGRLEIWTPNGLRIAETFVQSETGGRNDIDKDGWYRFNPEHDPCIWANGRLFSYGAGDGNKRSPNWHMAMFSPRYLRKLMEAASLVDVTELDRSAVRGHDHGWINLGFSGRKP